MALNNNVTKLAKFEKGNSKYDEQSIVVYELSLLDGAGSKGIYLQLHKLIQVTDAGWKIAHQTIVR